MTSIKRVHPATCAEDENLERRLKHNYNDKKTNKEWLKCHQFKLSFDANFSFFLLAEMPPRYLQITAYSTGLLIRNVVQLCLAANNILLMRK